MNRKVCYETLCLNTYTFSIHFTCIYSCLYTRLLDLYNLWVNDDIDRGLFSLSFFLTPFFFFFFSPQWLYIIRDGSASEDDSNSLYITFIRIVTATTNNFLRFFFLKTTHAPFLLTSKAYLSYSTKQSEEREGK